MKDTQVSKIIAKEKARQKKTINLIASENYVSRDVLEALGSELTNKYAEGYSKNRYYGGNEYVDELDDLTRTRALKLFKLSPQKWSVNIQGLSGSPANLAVLSTLVPFGETIMGMDLSSGGHLTHGSKVSLTGKLWRSVTYSVDPKTETLNYDEILNIAKRERPKLIIAGFTAYPRKIDWKAFRNIANTVGAILMVDMSHLSGLVAGGAYPSPFSYADVVTTTTHKTLRGPRSALIFSKKEFSEKIDKAIFPGLQGGPHMNQIASVAVALHEAMQPAFKNYAKQVIKNAKAMADEFKRLGVTLVSGGTDSHLILLDTIQSFGISGGVASTLLEKEGIIVNKNTVPFDTRKPSNPSGIRIGTPAETTRGKKEKDFRLIAQKIVRILKKSV
jgi:glycine hydroxymethyltransferase